MQSELGRRFVSKKAIADHIGVHPSTVDRWVREGHFPQPVKISERGRCRWPANLVAQWESTRVSEACGHSAQPVSAEQGLAT